MDTIARAHQRAQRRFHRMIVDATFGDPNDRRTRLYVEAGRLLDRLNAQAPEVYLDAAHEAALAEMDELADQELGPLLADVPMAEPLFIPYTELEARWAAGDR